MPLLEPIMKGLIEWIYEMVVGIMEYAAKELVGVMRWIWRTLNKPHRL